MRRASACLGVAVAVGLLLPACGRFRSASLYLVPIHAAPELIEPLAQYYREHLGLDVKTLGALQPDSLAYDASRRQLIAEELIKMLRDSYPVQGRSAAVVGVTSWDMYIRNRPWGFGFSWRAAPYAVVSYRRMDPAGLRDPPSAGPSGDERLLRRLRKMVSRNVGILIFGMNTNADRTSLMYQDIMGVDDLDAIDEDLVRAGFPGVR